MSRTFLCTAGTSIAQGCMALPSFSKRLSSWDEPATALRAGIRERIAQFDLSSAPVLASASAELNILHRLSPSPEDEIVLFVTDTAEGRACAEELREVLLEHFRVSGVILERIPGLQAQDAAALRHTGISNLTRRLIHYLADPQRRYGGCVLCPNGGFKGVVPFITILGMIHRAPVMYVFEFSEALIKLPPLPIGIAGDLFDRVLPALQWGKLNSPFDPIAFHRLIPGFSDDELESFNGFLEIEPDPSGRDLASLSPFALSLCHTGSSDEGVAIFLSRKAMDDLTALNGRDLAKVTEFLRKISNPLWREQHIDRKVNSDLQFFPKGHVSWRFAGFVQNDGFHLCWFARHDDYERWISTLTLSAFPADSFIPYTPPIQEIIAFPDGEDPDYPKTWEDLRAERDRHAEEIRILRNQISSLESAIHKPGKTLREEGRREIPPHRAAPPVLLPSFHAAFPHTSAGSVVAAVFVGTKGATRRFHLDGNPGLSVRIPRALLEPPPATGAVLNVRLLAWENDSFLAEPVH